jgi:hypothetical protein
MTMSSVAEPSPKIRTRLNFRLANTVSFPPQFLGSKGNVISGMFVFQCSSVYSSPNAALLSVPSITAEDGELAYRFLSIYLILPAALYGNEYQKHKNNVSGSKAAAGA